MLNKDLMLILSIIFASLAMCFPERLGFLSFVFLVPLLFLFSKVSSQKKIYTINFVFAFCFAVISSSWLTSAYPLNWLKIDEPILGIGMVAVMWMSFSLVMALPMSFYFLATGYFKSTNIVLNSVLGASVWVILEYVRSWSMAFSYYGPSAIVGPHHTHHTLGYSVYDIPVLRELLPFGGLYLASFFIILFNYFLYYLISTTFNKNLREKLFLLLILLIIVLVSGLFMLQLRSKNEPTETFLAAVTNVYFPRTTSTEIAKEKEGLTFELVSSIKGKKDVVILPEGVNILPSFKSLDQNKRKTFEDLTLIVGTTINDGYNSMYFLDTKSGEVSYYNKQVLMPVGEYSVDLIRWLIKITGNQSWLTSYDFSIWNLKKGNGSFVYKSKIDKTLTLGGGICSENISPYVYLDANRLGSVALLNLVSRTSFPNSPLASRQTLAVNSARALENGRYLVTASNYDKSFVVSDKGDVVAKSTTTSSKYSYFDVEIPKLNYKTPYVLFGNYILIFAFILVLGHFLVRRLE